MMNTPINSDIVDLKIKELGVPDIGNASIREIVQLVSSIESVTGDRYIRMEMGVPGLPPAKVGVEAEIEALKNNVAAAYPRIDGIQPLKDEASRFVKLFMDIDVKPEGCIPTVGSMEGSYAAFLVSGSCHRERDTVLFIDPGFPVQKQQLLVMGQKYETFDIFDYRGSKLRDKLESYLSKGNINSIIYSNPNNPSWICFDEEELKIIGDLANKYDVVIIEDLAYFGMDFRQHYGQQGVAPFQPTVAHYTDNYILLLSASKIFSYAGQRIGMMVTSEKLRTKHYPNLKNYFTSDTLGHFMAYGVLYATTAGTSHSAQYAFASVLKAVNDGKIDFVKELHAYGEKAKIMKALFLKYGFYIVYNDEGQDLADGFYFTIAFQGLTSGELMQEFLYYGISAISLAITGSENPNGLRACVSFVRMDQMGMLEERLKKFKETHN